MTTTAPAHGPPTGWDRVDQVRAEPDADARARAVDVFLANPDVQRLCRNVATACARQFGVPVDEREDVFMQVLAAAWRLLVEDTRYARARHRRSFEATLRLEARQAVKSYVESPGYLGSAGMSSVVRRHRSLAGFANQLAIEHGEQLSAARVVEAYNTRVAAARVDAARQGALATVGDMDGAARCGLVDHLEVLPALSLPAVPGPEEDVAVRLVIAEVVEQCRRVEAELAQVALLYLTPALAGQPRQVSAPEVAASVGIPVKRARRHIAQVLTTARQVAARHGLAPTG